MINKIGFGFDQQQRFNSISPSTSGGFASVQVVKKNDEENTGVSVDQRCGQGQQVMKKTSAPLVVTNVDKPSVSASQKVERQSSSFKNVYFEADDDIEILSVYIPGVEQEKSKSALNINTCTTSGTSKKVGPKSRTVTSDKRSPVAMPMKSILKKSGSTEEVPKAKIVEPTTSNVKVSLKHLSTNCWTGQF